MNLYKNEGAFMKISKNQVVSIAYQLRNQDGVLIDESPANQPLTYLHGNNNLIIGLEKALEGKTVGDKIEVRVEPQEGYGEYNEAMVQRVPKSAFQGVDNLEAGMRFIAETNQGPLPVVITAVDGDEVVVDGNHMLAGQPLHFNVEITDIREGTAEEIAQGHIAMPNAGGCCGGHEHHGEGCCGSDHQHNGEGCCGGDHHHEDDCCSH